MNQVSNRSNGKRYSTIAIIILTGILVVGGVLLFFLLRDMDWELLRQTSPTLLIAVVALSAITTIFYTLMVTILVRSSGYHTTFKQAYLVLTSSLSANYVTPVKAGIPLRVYLYRHLMGIPAAIGTSLVAVEALVGILIPAIISILGIPFFFPAFGLANAIILVCVLLVFVLIFLYTPVNLFQKGLERLPFSRYTVKMIQFVRKVQIGTRQTKPSALVAVIVLDISMLGIQAFRLWLILRILGHAPNFFALLAAFTTSLTAGNLSMIPMGLGVRDASLTLLLVQLGLQNEIALSAAVIQRLFAPGWPLLLGIISTYLLGISEILNRPKSKK